MKRVRILLADDHRLTLKGIHDFLTPSYEVVGEVFDGGALVEAALRLRPDLILLDVTMPVMNGIDAARLIAKELPYVKLVFLTMHLDAGYLRAALAAGAAAYVVKTAAAEELMDALESALAGTVYVSPGISSHPVDEYPGRTPPAVHLSVREQEVLQLLSEGCSSKEIAFRLSISARTVGFHRENIRHKLGISTTAEMTRYVIAQSRT